MAKYKKGADAERELIHALWGLGLATARVAGSGSTKLPMPDLIALGNGKKLAFECKAWDSPYLNISEEQMAELDIWSMRAGAEYYIAWKVPRTGWYFLKKGVFKKLGKNYTITRKIAMENSVKLEVIVGSQSRLAVGGMKDD